MENNKLETISNLFEDSEIRSVWDSEKEEYYFSVVDVIGALTNSSTGLTAATMFGVVEDLVPFIVMIVPVSLGIYFLRKLIKGSGKGKVRM